MKTLGTIDHNGRTTAMGKSVVRAFEISILADEAVDANVTRQLIERVIFSGLSEMVGKGEIDKFDFGISDMARQTPGDFGMLTLTRLVLPQGWSIGPVDDDDDDDADTAIVVDEGRAG